MLGQVKRAQYGLGAERRLRKRGEFVRLLREGRRRSLSGFTFYMAARERGPARLGILISRKHSERATVRNRIKRCIREAFRLEQSRLGSLDVLVRPPMGAKPGAAMQAQLRELLARLDK